MGNFKEDLKRVKAFIFDVDGVFTNSNVYLHPNGDLMRSMNIKDGYAVQYAVRKGYPIAIISGGNSESIRTRFVNLGVTDIYLKYSDKKLAYYDFVSKYSFKHDEILYMGDDIPDYEVMQLVGFPTCPSNAVEEIKSISVYISDRLGGDGCVRDVIEQVLKLQGKWLNDDAFAW